MVVILTKNVNSNSDNQHFIENRKREVFKIIEHFTSYYANRIKTLLRGAYGNNNTYYCDNPHHLGHKSRRGLLKMEHG